MSPSLAEFVSQYQTIDDKVWATMVLSDGINDFLPSISIRNFPFDWWQAGGLVEILRLLPQTASMWIRTLEADKSGTLRRFAKIRVPVDADIFEREVKSREL